MSIRRHTALNVMGQASPLLLALLTVPTYLGLIGDARFGALAIVWLLVNYFGLFDLGLGQACSQRLARLSNSAAALRARVLGSALSGSLVLGVTGSLVAWPVASWFFGETMSIEPSVRAELIAAMPWILFAVPVATMGSVFNGALQSHERFVDLNVIAVLGHAGVQLGPLAVAVFISPSLTLLIPVVVATRIIALVLSWLQCRRHVYARLALSFDWGIVRDLLRFGGWVSISATVGPLMVVLDRFAVGALIGAREVGHYTIPFQLAERATLLSAALNSALFPRLTVADSAPRQQQLSAEALRILGVLTTPAIAFGILFIEPFLSWWVSPDVALEAGVAGKVLLLGFWVNSLAMVPYTQLQAAGRPDLVAKCHLAELIPYLTMLYAGLHYAGLVGAAAAFALRAGVDFLLLAQLAGVMRSVITTLWWPASALMLLLASQTMGGMQKSWSWAGWLLCVLVLTFCAAQALNEWRRYRGAVARSR